MQLSRVLAAASMGLLAVGVAQPAFAFTPTTSYFSASSPLNAYDDGVVQAQMYGTFLVQDATYLRNNTNQRDPRPGGDSVFERTQFYFQVDGNWSRVATQQSEKTSTSSWYSQYDRLAFVGAADKGRMRTQVCEDHGIWADPCSDWPMYTTDL